MSYLLIIGDDQSNRDRMKAILSSICQHEVVSCSVGEWKTSYRDDEDLELVVLQSEAGVAAVNKLAAELAHLDSDLPVVINVAEGVDLSGASSSVCCVLPTPVQASYLYQTLAQAKLFRRLGMNPQCRTDGFQITGNSEVMQVVRRMIERVGPTEAGILILGDSGTGKELVAKHLHDYSARSKGPFVPINCGALPEALLESELFGHEKGAFTGAITTRKGRFELAKGGTLFLDEIGDMPLDMQVKLLRVLQERVFEPLGSTRTIEADVRIVAATHRNLEERVERGLFREDLFYRLNVVPIELPPLKDRAGDIPLLINEMLHRMNLAGRETFHLSPAALDALERCPWPGNVRELSNLVERFCVLYPYMTVGVSELPEKYQAYALTQEQPLKQDLLITSKPVVPCGNTSVEFPAEGVNLKQKMNDLEADFISQALAANDYVVAKTARKLSINRTTLIEKMRKYGLADK